jgi:Na+-transporting methylmalonyl-CoA/oxaloacetate decarboxylase gamma subunit
MIQNFPDIKCMSTAKTQNVKEEKSLKEAKRKAKKVADDARSRNNFSS